MAIGRKGIAHIGGHNTSPSVDRRRGFADALNKRGRKLPDNYVIKNELVEEGGDAVGFRAMQTLLSLRARPDAVFCYNDLTAIGAIEAILAAGLQVPKDIAVIGCGNFRYAGYLRVPLSSIDQGTTELGRIAGEVALEFSAHLRSKPRSIVLQPSLVIRASTLANAS